MDTRVGVDSASIHLAGRVRVVSSDGTECPVRGRRGRGILAVLALSPDMTRARTILQEMFWPNRSTAAGSLRSELYNLRRDLGRCGDILDSDPSNVWLLSDRVRVDVADFDAVGWSREWGGTPPRLMEDLDLDHDFDHWRVEQQSIFEDRFLAALSQESSALPDASNSGLKGPPVVRIVNPEAGEDGTSRFSALMVSEAVWRGMREYGGVVLTGDTNRPVDLEISIAVRTTGNRTSVVIFLTDVASGVGVWSAGRDFEGGLERFAGTSEFRLFVNEAAYVCVSSIARLARYDRQAVTNTLRAVDLMMRADPALYDQADTLLQHSFAIDGDAIHLAWRAYLRTFMRAENVGSDTSAIRMEAEALSRKALEIGSQNSLVLALVSHVHSFILQNPASGYDLAERALACNPANPFALAYMGRAKSYMGDHETAFRLTSEARRIAGPVPYRHTLDFMAGVAALLSGRHDEAIHLGEVAISQVTAYRAPMRYLLPLYANLGKRQEARRILDRIRLLEPNFSIDRLKDEAYPNAAVRQADLLDFSQIDLD